MINLKCFYVILMSSSFRLIFVCHVDVLVIGFLLGWLDDIGLPQYKTQFDEGRVDGRMLHYMTVVSASLQTRWVRSSDNFLYLESNQLQT